MSWPAAAGEPATVTFDPVRTSRLRLDPTSSAPDAPNRFPEVLEVAAG